LSESSSGYSDSLDIVWLSVIELEKLSSEREKTTQRQHREHMQQSLEQALQLVEGSQEDHDRPMRQTLCFVNAALLAQTHGMPVDRQRLLRAAQNCLTYGYRSQAEKLLALPDTHIWLPEDALRNLASLVQEEKS
jgi:hypothetical protein